MKMKTGIVAAVASCAVAGVAQGQKTLAFDVNDFGYTAIGDWSDPLDFDGSIELSFVSGVTEIENDTARLGFAGELSAWTDLAIGSALLDFDGELFFTDSKVTGGEFTMTLANGDKYTADVSAWVGSATVGRILEDAPGIYRLRMETFDGAFVDPVGFDDDEFGDIDVSDWVAWQGLPGPLFGDFVKFSFGASSTGEADGEIFVMVPLPTAAYAGLGMLAGVMGLSYVLRRR